jgi:hypothetical protein
MSVLISTEPFVFPVEANRLGATKDLAHLVFIFYVTRVDKVLGGRAVVEIVYDLLLLALTLPYDLFGYNWNLADSNLRNDSKARQIMYLRQTCAAILSGQLVDHWLVVVVLLPSQKLGRKSIVQILFGAQINLVVCL